MRRWACLMSLLLGVSACAPPDRWGFLQPDWEHELANVPEKPVEVPTEDQPQPADATFPTLDAEGPVELSVEQATLLALRNNRDLHVVQLNPTIAATFEEIERGQFDPELFAEGSYAHETALEVARSTGQQFGVDGNDTGAIAGVRQQLPTGTAVETSVEQTRSISNRSPEQQEARVGLGVTQQLLRGFGPAVNLARVRQAELETLATRYELRGFTESLLAETEIAYWNFILAREEIAIFDRSLEIARSQRDEIEQRIDVGVLPRTEAAAARTEVALREQALINARSRLESRRVRLLRLMNPNPRGTLDAQLVATTDPRLEPEPIADTDDRMALSQRLRPDLNEARLRLDQNRLEIIVTRNGLLPRLELFIALGKTGFGDTFSESFRELDGETYDAVAGVRFNHYLGNRAAEARDTAARASRQQAAAAVANLEQLILVDVRLAIIEAERARQQITASATTRALQEQTVGAEQERFNVGISTTLLVAQAQRDLLVAQIAEVEAVINYRIALVNLYLAEGSLLERRGIALGETSDAYRPY